jgi:hypothetical protein
MRHGILNESLPKTEALKPNIGMPTSNSALSIPDSLIQAPSKTSQINQKSSSSLEQDKGARSRERGRDIYYKRPSELRSRGTTPRGTTIKFCESDEQETEDVSSDETSASDDAPVPRLGEVGDKPPTVITNASSSASLEVPLLSLVVNKRKGKSKGEVFFSIRCL